MQVYKFFCERLNLTIEFTELSVNVLQKYRQTFCRKESGGMLFCEALDDDVIRVSCVSEPDKKDIRSFFFFKHNDRAAQSKIDFFHQQGLHYVGDWHTHPQLVPTPSQQDIDSIKSIYNNSKHHLQYMILLIVSSDISFGSSYLIFTDGRSIFPCSFVVENDMVN